METICNAKKNTKTVKKTEQQFIILRYYLRFFEPLYNYYIVVYIVLVVNVYHCFLYVVLYIYIHAFEKYLDTRKRLRSCARI